MESKDAPEWAKRIDEMTVEIDGHRGELMTVEEFQGDCEDGVLIDYDGMADIIRDGKIVTPEKDHMPVWTRPSNAHTIPSDITHVLWYNR